MENPHGHPPTITAHLQLMATNHWLQPLINFSRWFLLYSLGLDHTENTTSNSSSIVACWFVAAEMCLLCHCLARATSSCPTNPAFSRHVMIWSLSSKNYITMYTIHLLVNMFLNVGRERQRMSVYLRITGQVMFHRHAIPFLSNFFKVTNYK
jgi:hypothetical protein